MQPPDPRIVRAALGYHEDFPKGYTWEPIFAPPDITGSKHVQGGRWIVSTEKTPWTPQPTSTTL